MSSKVVGGPTLEQKRRIVTAIPGPKSVEMQKRRVEVVSAGVSSTLPVYVKRAGGGIIEDIDGNSFIDLASGIVEGGQVYLGGLTRDELSGAV
jgi:4-aminobutyrate aminotransferase/(S)-3-amino-2-methylpropionate transaminase